MDSNATLGFEKLNINLEEIKGAKRAGYKARRAERKAQQPFTAVAKDDTHEAGNPSGRAGSKEHSRAIYQPVTCNEHLKAAPAQFTTSTYRALIPSYTPLNVRPLGTPLGIPSRAQSTAYDGHAPLPPVFAPIHGRTIYTPANPPRKARKAKRAAKSAPVPTITPTYTEPPLLSTNINVKAYHNPRVHGSKPRPIPSPTPAYLLQSATPPTRLSTPQSLLIILDLNGTLVHRSKSSTGFHPRPHLKEFLTYCFAHHSVMIWSSARPHNVRRICNDILEPGQGELLLGEWARDTFGLSRNDFMEKVQVYKQLSRVWASPGLQRRCPDGKSWGQHSTVLVDDGAEKARAEPWNLVNVPEYLGPNKGDEVPDVLVKVAEWMEEARGWSDVSAFAGAMGRVFVAGKEGGGGGVEVKGGEGGQKGEASPAINEEEGSESDDSDTEGGVKLPI